jgi:CheY-like chemotaxis protein
MNAKILYTEDDQVSRELVRHILDFSKIESGELELDEQSLMVQRHPLRILLAEDNSVDQEVALGLLGKMGYRADVVSDGLEVLEALEQQPYDVILMDVRMPELDGLEATRCIRERWFARRQPKIIAMAASAMQADRELCLEAGVDDYISKPVRMEGLADVLSKCRPLVLPADPASAPPGHAGSE